MTRFALCALLAGCYTSSTARPPAPEPVEEPPPPKKKRPPPPVARTGCDEVSCVLDNYAGNCCDRYRKRPSSVPAPPQKGLDRQQIQTAISAVRPQVMSCGGSGAKGTWKVTVQVAPDGGIVQLKIVSSPDPAVDACVLAALGSAVFPATDLGGVFSYPFVF